MTKYKTDIAAAASSMMELPGTLEGMLHDIHGQVEVSPAAVPSIASSTSPTEAKKKNSSKTSAKVLEQPKIVNGDALWTAFWEQCATESQQPKTVGKDGNVSFCKVDKDILATFKKYVVGGYTTQTVVNAILRSFILHYKKNFNVYRKSEKSLL